MDVQARPSDDTQSPPKPTLADDKKEDPSDISKFPYSVYFSLPEDSLPEPLPTIENIRNSKDKSRDWGDEVKRISKAYVVKYGAKVDVVEADNMLFVQQNTDIRIPRLYAVYIQPTSSKTITYIIMENIPGKTLESLWPTLEDAEKTRIALNLRDSLSVLRKIRKPTSAFENLGGRELRDGIFQTSRPHKRENIQGKIPRRFENEAAFISGLVTAYRVLEEGEGPKKADWYEHVLPTVLKTDGQPPVFTHNDLHLRNIMITPDGDPVIIDWELSGWYPCYWEYSTAMCAFSIFKDDWYVYLGRILDEYPAQYLWVRWIMGETMLW